MKKFITLILLFIFLAASPLSAGNLVNMFAAPDAGQVSMELGYVTVGSEWAGSSSNRCMQITPPSDWDGSIYYNVWGFTSDGGTDGTFEGYVLNDNGGVPGSTVVGQCTASTDIVDGGSAAWNVAQGTLTSPAGTPIWACVSFSEPFVMHYDNDVSGSSYYVAQSGCGATPGSASIRKMTFTVSTDAIH